MAGRFDITTRDFAAILALATVLLVGVALVSTREQPNVRVVATEHSVSTTSAISINTAGVEELTLLPGIGPHRAKMIVADRTRNGAFLSVDSLQRIYGIGPGIVESLRPHVTVEQ